jgi:hypothetical protein
LFLFGGGAKSKQDTLWTLADEASYRKFNNLCQPFYCADQSLLTPPPAGSVDDLKESQCRAKEDWESKLYKARQMFTEGTGTQVCGQLSPVESPGLMRRWRKKLPSWRNH